ncbi:MAG TPA: hypothetical protein PK523_13075 [Elusimicrobiales bacterium]|jgi:hypothetical protein|nr:hypothetical protein [Elusimicrobiales bacterium]
MKEHFRQAAARLRALPPWVTALVVLALILTVFHIAFEIEYMLDVAEMNKPCAGDCLTD